MTPSELQEKYPHSVGWTEEDCRQVIEDLFYILWPEDFGEEEEDWSPDTLDDLAHCLAAGGLKQE